LSKVLFLASDAALQYRERSGRDKDSKFHRTRIGAEQRARINALGNWLKLILV